MLWLIRLAKLMFFSQKMVSKNLFFFHHLKILRKPFIQWSSWFYFSHINQISAVCCTDATTRKAGERNVRATASSASCSELGYSPPRVSHRGLETASSWIVHPRQIGAWQLGWFCCGSGKPFHHRHQVYAHYAHRHQVYAHSYRG